MGCHRLGGLSCCQQSPGEIKSMEVEMGSPSTRHPKTLKPHITIGCHSWMDCLTAELFLNNCFSDTVFVTLFRAAVETVISEVHKLLGTGGVPVLTLNTVVLSVADRLFGRYGSESRDELLIGTRHFPVLNKSLWFPWT